MSKKRQKISRKLKEKKLLIARKERNKRRSKRQDVVVPKTKNIDLSLIIKKNIIPVSVLISGCFIFYISSFTDYRPSFSLPKFEFPHRAYAAEPDAQNTKAGSSKIKYTVSKNYIETSVELPPIISTDKLSEIISTESDQVFSLIKPELKKVTEIKNEKKPIVADKPKISIVPTVKKKEKKSSPIKIASVDPFKNTEDLKAEIGKIIKNTPMEAMLEDIIQRDRAVAAFLVGIGMKESKYGIYSPKKNGSECFNYWGYRGKENKTKSGYSCFDSPAHAIQVVGDRIEALVKNGRNTPDKMIVWKCGSTCAGHSEESVDKWIADVSINYYRLNPMILSKK